MKIKRYLLTVLVFGSFEPALSLAAMPSSSLLPAKYATAADTSYATYIMNYTTKAAFSVKAAMCGLISVSTLNYRIGAMENAWPQLARQIGVPLFAASEIKGILFKEEMKSVKFTSCSQVKKWPLVTGIPAPTP